MAISYKLVAALLICTPIAAQAGDNSFYIKADGAYGITNDPAQKNNGTAQTQEDTDNLAAFTVGAGYAYNKNIRTDVTFGYRPGVDSTSFQPSNSTTSKGSVDGYSLMLNGYYDITQLSNRFTPYVGAGIGWSHLVSDDAKITNAAGTINLTEGGDSKDNLGWMVTLGSGFSLTESTTLDMGYRFMSQGKSKNNGTYSGTPAGYGPDGGSEAETLYTHEIYLGLRYAF